MMSSKAKHSQTPKESFPSNELVIVLLHGFAMFPFAITQIRPFKRSTLIFIDPDTVIEMECNAMH
jgi:hypothetical protein